MAAKIYDALVIGSGASGSFAAKELTERGLEVLLLEAGRDITPADFQNIPKGPVEKGIQLWHRIVAAIGGQHVQSKVALYGRQFKHLFVNDREHPYTTTVEQPFLWIRGKQLGGRLHTYGRVLLRWSDYDFKAASHDGRGENWPISYADLAPYYDQAEQFLGVYGTLDHLPNLPDGKFVKASKLSNLEQVFKTAVETRWPERHPIPWRYTPPNSKRIPQAIIAAQATGRLTLRADSIVRRILVDPATGKANGAEVIDRISKDICTVRANVVVVCASPIESVRLLLNSTSPQHPNGLANSSGVLGHYFMDQVPSLIFGIDPNSEGNETDDTVPADPYYGVTGGVYVPRWENLDRVTNANFARGFGYQGTIGRLYVRPGAKAKFGIMGFGEMLPNFDNAITLHPHRKDRWGVPLPHIRCWMGDNERAMLQTQTEAIKQMVESAGLEVEWIGSPLGLREYGRGAFSSEDPLSRFLFRRFFGSSMTMGAAIHESGGARMGVDPAKSVLNAFNQSWDVKNLFVTDASSFPTSGSCGTTLTIMALTIRACEYIANEYRAGTL